MANQMLDEVERVLARSRTGQVGLQLPDVMVATGACLAAVGAGAIPGWFFLAGRPIVYLGLIVVLMAAGFWVARRSPVSAPIALGYSALLGLMVGAFSNGATAGGGMMGLIVQALVGTSVGAVAVLAVYATPFGRRAARATRLLFALVIGYALLSIVSVVAGMFFGVGGGWGFFGVGALGVALCLFGVALACWSLLADIGATADAIASGAPRSWAWSFGMALASSLVWMYLEILRLLSLVNR